MIRTSRRLVMLAAVAAVASSAGAQEVRAPKQLSMASQIAINAVLDSAKAMGLPSGMLSEKMYEGMAKGADGPRIAATMHALFFDMVTIRSALGPVASTDELKAGASAMQAGVPAVELGKMKKQGGKLRSLATPFTVAADLISRGVPVGTAVNAMKSLVGAGAKDKDINDFQRNVKEDIQQGAPPAAAAETRAKGATSNGKPDAKPDAKPDQNDQILL